MAQVRVTVTGPVSATGPYPDRERDPESATAPVTAPVTEQGRGRAQDRGQERAPALGR